MRLPALVLISLVVLVMSSCSGMPTGPSEPGIQPVQTQSDTVTGGRQVLGVWELLIDPEAGTAEAIPLRFALGHFNVRKFMESGPCYTCFKLMNFVKNPDETFNIDVQFQHPFPGADNFTGFDVRGTAIFNGSYTFATSGLVMADVGLGDIELLNPDGYTTLFNPVDFPEGSDLPILTYSKGKRATLLSNPSTLNGFKAFFPDEPRRVFRAGETDTRNYHIAWPTGKPMRVGYVIDANWAVPINKPVHDPLTDFGPEANCLEAYKIEAVIGSGLMPGCGFAPYQVDVYDHQGYATVGSISFEAPDLFTGVIAGGTGVDMGDFTRFTGNLPNQLKAGAGTYRVLIGVNDTQPDPFLGNLTAYAITQAVVEWAPIDYENGWRKQGKTLDNSSFNSSEAVIQPNLSEVWHHQFLPESASSTFEGFPVLGSSALYVVANIPFNQRIWALSLVDGEPIWYANIKLTSDIFAYSSTPTVGNCEVYVGGSSLFAFDSESDELLWFNDDPGSQFINGSPVVADGICAAWANNNILLGVDAFSGDTIWQYTTGEAQGNPGTPLVQNGTLWAGDINGYAFALDLQSGAKKWKTQFPAGGPIFSASVHAQPVMAGGLVWFGSWNCRLYGLDPSSGGIIHDVPLGNQLLRTGPAFDGTHLYVPTAFWEPYEASFTPPYRVLALNTDGSEAWSFEGTDTEAFFGTPAVANNVVWVASDAGKLYMLDPSTGDLVGQGTYTLDNPVESGVCVQDGRLYVIDTGGVLYCLE